MERILLTGSARSGTTLLMFLMRYFPRTIVLDREWNILEHAKEIAATIRLEALRQPDADLVVIKSPKNVTDWQKAIDLGYRVIFMLRDPRDILCSRHPQKPDDYWVSFGRLRSAVSATRQGIQQANFEGHTQLVKYEDLVSEPFETTFLLGTFINRAIDNEFIEFFNKDKAANIFSGNWTETAKALNGLRPLTKDRIGNWRRPEHREHMQAILAKHGPELSNMLETFDYERSGAWAAQFLEVEF